MSESVALVTGETYRAGYGGTFYCQRGGVTPRLQNVASGWTLTAHLVRRDAAGSIYWAYSTNGAFEPTTMPWP